VYKIDHHHQVEDHHDVHNSVRKTKNDRCHRIDKLIHHLHTHLDHNNNADLREDSHAQVLATKLEGKQAEEYSLDGKWEWGLESELASGSLV
jgi:hypothetical protein